MIAVNFPGRILPDMWLSLVLLLVIMSTSVNAIATGAVLAIDSCRELDFLELFGESLAVILDFITFCAVFSLRFASF